MRQFLPFKLRVLDYVIILVAVAITVATAVFLYGGGASALQVVVEGSGKTWIFPLGAEETLQVPGPIGTTVVRIHEKQAWIESSPCRDKLCVAAGKINRSDQWVACLPNKVFVRIKGKSNDEGPDWSTW